jgi:glycine/D-amino acid oxidase-like deaminating enzyme
MDQFDFVIIGAGGAGEAAAHEARRRGATVAIIDRELTALAQADTRDLLPNIRGPHACWSGVTRTPGHR